MKKTRNARYIKKNLLHILARLEKKKPIKYEENKEQGSDEVVMTLRTLNGNDCLKALQNMDLCATFPEKLLSDFPKLPLM